MSVKVTNNSTTTLAASIAPGATVATLLAGSGTFFPVLAAGDWFWATLNNAAGQIEVVKVTATALDAMTILRAQDGTAAGTWNPGDKFELRPTAALFNDKLGVVDAAALYGPAGVTAFVSGKNRIINGSCLLNQYAVTPTAGSGQTLFGGVDRYVLQIGPTAGGTCIQQQSTIVRAGVTHQAISQTVVTVVANLAGTNFWSGINQRIEGYNCFDLKGQQVSVSFEFNATVSGVYSVALVLGDGSQSAVTTFNYVAGQQNRIQVTFPTVPASATIPDNTTANGLVLRIGGIAQGTMGTAVLNTWVAGNFFASTGSTNWASTIGNAIVATDIQLEAGPVCTPFERESVPVTIVKCQRYYRRIGASMRMGAAAAGALADTSISWTDMRAVPTATLITAPGTSNLSGAATLSLTSSNAGRYEITAAAAGDCFSLTAVYGLSAEI